MKLPILFSILSLSTAVVAESDIKVCGRLTFEKSMDTSLHGNKKVFAISVPHSLGWRFELAPNGPQEESYLKALITSAKARPGTEAVVCARGYFAGSFSYSGFSTGGETYSRGRIIPAQKLEAFEYYKNFSR